MAKQLVKFDVGGLSPLTPFTIKQGTSFTVPKTKTQTSPTGDAKLSSVVDVGGGQMLLGANDAATPATFDLTKEAVCDLYPGDVVALSAVAANISTLTVTSVDGTVRTFLITGVTTVAMACGYYG